MAYTALYRKWRPITFDDVVGQQSVTETLKNEIEQGRIGHAYLFCGIRGTGKTSTARILSRAINCKHPQNGNPCNECENCRGILDGTILDITEIDAASNNGVENIRSLREEARFSGSVLKERVYIIDEVHMLSTNAFNALLKILEEPPQHVRFILATTEAHKVPATILSRCQRFDFKRITTQDIVAQLRKILDSSGTAYDIKAVEIIADAADGSMRDSLSILDQCLSVGTGSLSYDDVSGFLGVTDRKIINGLIERIAASDVNGAFDAVDEIIKSGKSLAPVAVSLTKAFRDIMIQKYSGQQDGYTELFSPQKLVQLTQLASQIPAQMRTSVDQRLTFELALIKMTDPSYDESYEGIVARLSQLEEKLKNGITVQAKKPEKVVEKKQDEVKKTIPDKKEDVTASPDLTDTFYKIKKELMDKFKVAVCSALDSARLIKKDGKCIVLYPSRDIYNSFKDILSENKQVLQQSFDSVFGEAQSVEFSYENTDSNKQSDSLTELYTKNRDIIS